jgi:hypothetical protein
MMEPANAAAPSSSPRGQKLWAVLLVLDSLFVIVFGGALAAKVYQHWGAPSPTAASRSKRTPPSKAAPKPVEPAPVVKAEPKPEPKPEPAPAKAADGPRPPKPSLLNEPPKREAAAPKDHKGAATAKAAPAPAPAPAADASAAPKAVPVSFQLKAPDAKKVELAGAFIVRGGGRKSMVKRTDGTWTLTVYLTPNNYRYNFLVDGQKTLDPSAAATERGASVKTVAAP